LLRSICFAVFSPKEKRTGAVFLTEVRGVPESLAGWAHLLCGGDDDFPLNRRTAYRPHGRSRGGGGAIVAAVGFALVTFVPQWQLSLVGYVLVLAAPISCR
jgi:hypothetical protein